MANRRGTATMDWKENFFSIVIGAALLAASAWLAYTPWTAAHALAQAARGGDEEALVRLIDFDKVSAGLKGQLEAQLDAAMAQASANDPAKVLDAALAEAFIGPAVDMLLQPSSIAAMMNGSVPKSNANADDPPPAQTDNEDTFAVSMGYESLNSFTIRANPKDSTTAPIVLVLTRQDSVSWKLTDIRLPKNAVATDEELATAATKQSPPAAGMSEFDGDCVDTSVAAFRAAKGERAELTPEMINGWMAECAQ